MSCFLSNFLNFSVAIHYTTKIKLYNPIIIIIIIMGYRNSSKVIMPRVIPMVEEGHYHAKKVTPSDSKAIARHKGKLHCRERTLEKGLALTWLRVWWLPPHLMHSTKLPGCIYMDKTPEQCYLGCHNSQEVWKSVWWDKHLSSGLDDQQMKDQDHLKGAI